MRLRGRWRSLASAAHCVCTTRVMRGKCRAICSICSYAGFLAVDNGWATDIDSAGYTAGLLPTALILGRLPTAIPWGMACDRWGTRRSLQVSMLSPLALKYNDQHVLEMMHAALGLQLLSIDLLPVACSFVTC